jgi:peptidoglycan hydrolase CwlO-like protein
MLQEKINQLRDEIKSKEELILNCKADIKATSLKLKKLEKMDNQLNDLLTEKE